MTKNLNKLSKFLAVVLRHKADDFNIILDDEGFTDVEPVWQLVQQRYQDAYTWDDLLRVVESDERGKKRYEIRDGRIRAMYGHSRGVHEVAYEAAEPPEILYHGTNATAITFIRDDGLKAQGRQYVHLTTNPKNAEVVGKRRTNMPILLQVRAKVAHDAGVVFHHAETEHYLARHIPPDYIIFPDN